jgi:hypothetical protein
LVLERSHCLKKVEVSSPEVGTNVGNLFSNASPWQKTIIPE